MTIADIIALAKQGYKPGDIKELVSLADVTENKEVSTVKETEDINVNIESQPEVKEENKGDSEKVIALQDEIEKLKAELNDIQKKHKTEIESIQIQNKKVDISGEQNKSESDLLSDVLEKFI